MMTYRLIPSYTYRSITSSPDGLNYNDSLLFLTSLFKPVINKTDILLVFFDGCVILLVLLGGR